MPNSIWERVGIEAEPRLRWLLRFGELDLDSLTDQQREAVRLEARAFLALQEVEPAVRRQLLRFPPPTAATPGMLTQAETRSMHSWLRKGLGRLRVSETWEFAPRVRYQLDAYRGLLFSRLRANSRVEQFKALAYDAFRDARFRFRLCPECSRPFVPVRRQSYCSSACSQAWRTRKWRSTHREKVRKMRRDQYRRSITGKLKVSKHAATRIRSSTLPRHQR